jgi:hypothetical protein
MISTFLHLLRLALSPKIVSILKKVPLTAEENVYYVVVG